MIPISIVNLEDPVHTEQPYLALMVRRTPCEHCGQQKETDRPNMLIEVSNRIDRFMRPRGNGDPEPTELLIRLCRVLKAAGYEVTEFGIYSGSAGPSHIYRDGVLYKRMSDELETPEVESIFDTTTIEAPKWRPAGSW